MARWLVLFFLLLAPGEPFLSSSTWRRSTFDVRQLMSLVAPRPSSKGAVIAGGASFSGTPFKAETDVMGQINFCLRATDSALSGPSRSKLLNELTNDVFKTLVIGDETGIAKTLESFEKFRREIESVPCFIDFSELPPNTRSRPVILLEDGTGVAQKVGDDPFDLACNVDGGFRDLQMAKEYVDLLEKLVRTGETSDEVLGGIYDKGYRGIITILKGAGCRFEEGKRPTPTDGNICLSLIDLATPIDTRTKTLNSVSNCVSRAVLYGGRREKDALAQTIEGMAGPFADEWCGSDRGAQEVLFLRALSMLLSKGLAATEERISSVTTGEGAIFGESRLEGGVGSVELAQPALRLYDTYTNAFQRVVELCLSEISARCDKVPQNEDVLLNFVQWEQSLRRNLTSEYWRENPAELVGTWELVDIAGQGSLQPIMIQDTDIYFGLSQGVKVELKKDGKVELNWPGVEGLFWYFKPGPAHLDTCEFFIRSKTDADLVLNYVGFIDRGQRIESRFVSSLLSWNFSP